MRGGAPTGRWLAALVGLLAICTDARGDGLSLYLEPTFTLTHLETQDQLGNGTQQDYRVLTQNYRLNFDRTLTPAFTIGAGGLFEARRTWTDDASGARTLDGNVRGLYARLTMNLPTLTSGLSYDLGSEQLNALPSLVNENLALYASWRPLELPELNLRLSRTHQYDTSRLNQDVTTLERARVGPVPHRALRVPVRPPVGTAHGRDHGNRGETRSTRRCRGSTAPGSSRDGRRSTSRSSSATRC